jgi:hypothetical protein
MDPHIQREHQSFTVLSETGAINFQSFRLS